MDWTTGGTWDPNPDFYRLLDTGPLHVPGDLVAGPPLMPLDYAVREDIERNPRPSGNPRHTDRGPFQFDLLNAGIGDRVAAAGLRLAPRRNPGPDPSLEFAALRDGVLGIEVLDAGGRSMFRESRRVVAGETGVIHWSAARPGAYFYRVRLAAPAGDAVVNGRCVVVR
jgi:hypothetical protein